MVYYMDTSALVKLIVNETETTVLSEWLAAEPRYRYHATWFARRPFELCGELK